MNLINQAIGNLSKFTPASYVYIEGTGKEKTSANEITILSANLLFMPQDFTYYFGGVSPWSYRINKIAQHIGKTNSDIVCLQEIHDEESAYALYRKLKHMYPYFYTNIGANVAVVDPNDISMNSGLFVASKFQLTNHHFEKFQVQGMQKGIHKGFFYSTVVVDKKPFCYLITTHLNPFDNDEARQVRESEAQLIVANIEKLQKTLPLPAVLVGDLNVDWGSHEWKHSILSGSFINAYKDKHPTCTDYFNDLVWTDPKQRALVKKVNYISDYALVYQAHPLHIESYMVPFYHLNKPLGALSDHQGIFSKIVIAK